MLTTLVVWMFLWYLPVLLIFWRVFDDPIGSDHLPIEISFNYENNPSSSYKYQHKRPNLSLAQFDKKIFMALISCYIDQFCTDSDGIQLYDK